MPHQDPEITLAENAEAPKKGKNNMGEWEQHPLQDQIKVADRIGGKAAETQRNWGLGLRKFNTPGTV